MATKRMKTFTAEGVTYEIVDEVARSQKLNLPKNSSGNIIFGTIGQFAVSDGNGGITWMTITNGNEVAY